MNRLIPFLNESDASVKTLGATIAIGLVGLRSGNIQIADQLDIPKTPYHLDNFRPEQILVRSISRCLILWDEIMPTIDWLEDQIPSFILASPTCKNAHVLHSYLSLLSGLAFAIGLKFAGTSNSSSFKTIISLIDSVMAISKSLGKVKFEDRLSQIISRSTLASLIVSLSMVMAGSGNMRAFGIISMILKSNSASDVSYGINVASNMALGLLFVGNGTCTIGTSNLSVAALYCSLFPIYPTKVTDNRYHLQALRHLWVLAIERRCLITRNVSSEIECVPVEIFLNDDSRQNPMRGCTPLILPAFATIDRIEVVGPRFWPLSVQISAEQMKSQTTENSWTLWIQRKFKYLSYMDVFLS